MKTALNSSAGRLMLFAVRQRKRLWRGGVALALAVPHASHPYGLEQLLRMPLEHLLQLQISPLQISPRRVSHAGAGHDHGGGSDSGRGFHAT